MTDNELIDRMAYEIWANNIQPKPSMTNWKTVGWANDKEKSALRKLAKKILTLVKRFCETS